MIGGEDRVKTDMEGLKTILNEWDFLGVTDSGIDDEYDCLNAPLLSMLYKGATKIQIRDHLTKELKDHFGLSVLPKNLDIIIGKIYRKSYKVPPASAAPPHRSKPQKNPKNIGSPVRLWREPYFNFGGRKFFNHFN